MLPSRTLSRRTLLGYGGWGAAVLLGTGALTSSESSAAARPAGDPFTLGVASGDPRSDGVVLWTRLAPEPLAPDGLGGMGKRPVTVAYQVAEDRVFRRVVRSGTVLATPELGFAVHPEIAGLAADRRYWYRFRVGSHLSPVGRTRTTPPPGAHPHDLRFAFASCQRWSDGFYTAYDHLAEEELDLVVHLGDYIYEGGITSQARGVALPSAFGNEAQTLTGYRLRYALYKSDPSLQRAHGRFPWIHTIDDHEVENDWAGDRSQVDDEPDQDPAVFRRRRAQAYRAMYENLPLRHAQLPSGAHVRLHRRLAYGRLADFTLLDTRQYRSDQPCGDGQSATCDDRYDPNATMLGGKQKRWLLHGLATSRARWQLLGNQVPMGQTDLDPDPDVTRVYLDPWDGYVAERDDVLAQAHRRGVRNLVVLTGDRHANQAMDLRSDFDDPGSPVVGAELVGTSISSGGDGSDLPPEGKQIVAANPHVHFYNGQRGYVRVRVTRSLLRGDFRVLPYVHRPGAPVHTRASYVVEEGAPGLQDD